MNGETLRSSDRLLAFDLAGGFYALPIAEVAEVMDVPKIAVVPMLPGRIGGVANQHGDVLPVVHGEPLLGLERIDDVAPTHLLVLARDLDDPDRYGLPVDRVHGLVDGPVPPAPESGVIAERRPVEGRLMNVLDAKRLLERAVSVIEQSMTEGGRNNGGES